jgi:hypothetical protein
LHNRAGATAYYLNGRLPRLALIGRGVRFPAGTWLLVADDRRAPWEVEPLVTDLFVALRDRPVRFAALLTDFDVEEFENRLDDDRPGYQGDLRTG